MHAGNSVDARDATTITLPTLDAEIDAPGDRIALHGPPGATLAVRIRRILDRDVLALTGTDVVRHDGWGDGGALTGQRSSGEPGRSIWAGNVTAGGDGTTEVRLAGTVDVQPGDTVEVQRVWAGDTFVLHRTAFQFIAGAGLRQPVAYSRPGERVAIDIRSSGRQRSCATTIGRAAWSSWSCGEPIAAGDRLTVSHSGGLLPLAHTAATIPPLEFRPGAGSSPATITGPPSGRVRFVEVDALGGPSGFDVVLDARGQGALPAGRPARGSRYAYAWRDGSGITWGRGGYVPQIRLVLGEPRLRGVWPTDAVTVTIAARDGTQLGRWTRQRTLPGSTRPIPLYDPRSGPQGPLHRLAPGERVEVAIGGDEPVVWTVPDLALQLDADRHQLTGRLPVGTRGTLTVLEAIDGDPDPLQPLDDLADSRFLHRATLPLSPAPDGAFAVLLTDLRNPDGFRLPAHRLVLYAVTAERADGNAVMAVLARPWLRIDAQSVTAEGFGPSGQAVEFEVTDANGRGVVQRRSDDANATMIDRPVWRVPLVDAVGAPTALRPGDRVTVTVGASRSSLTVPPMAAYVDLPGRTVRGRVAPNASFTVALTGDGWGERRWVVRAGTDGMFETPLPADVPLQHNDRGEIVGRVGPHIVTAQVVVPSMIADLSVGRIWGRGAAGAPVDVTVLRQGRAIASGRRLVDDGLTFDVDPHDAAGRHVRPMAGDVVVQRIAGRAALTLTVPALSARWVQADGAIVGASPPGSAVDVQRPTGFALTSADWDVGYAEVAATGAFTASARHRTGLTTGRRAPAGPRAGRRDRLALGRHARPQRSARRRQRLRPGHAVGCRARHGHARRRPGGGRQRRRGPPWPLPHPAAPCRRASRSSCRRRRRARGRRRHGGRGHAARADVQGRPGRRPRCGQRAAGHRRLDRAPGRQLRLPRKRRSDRADIVCLRQPGHRRRSRGVRRSVAAAAELARVRAPARVRSRRPRRGRPSPLPAQPGAAHHGPRRHGSRHRRSRRRPARRRDARPPRRPRRPRHRRRRRPRALYRHARCRRRRQRGAPAGGRFGRGHGRRRDPRPDRPAAGRRLAPVARVEGRTDAGATVHIRFMLPRGVVSAQAKGRHVCAHRRRHRPVRERRRRIARPVVRGRRPAGRGLAVVRRGRSGDGGVRHRARPGADAAARRADACRDGAAAGRRGRRAGAAAVGGAGGGHALRPLAPSRRVPPPRHRCRLPLPLPLRLRLRLR
ncbi:MAG: hypothetical protein IPG72_14405 [Ardenticatenales bacterium]|nr:hypothetical protein [Ardenticatenales bacterium]